MKCFCTQQKQFLLATKQLRVFSESYKACTIREFCELNNCSSLSMETDKNSFLGSDVISLMLQATKQQFNTT
jgi:hypothetical protein